MSGLAKEIYPQTGGKCVWLLFDVTGIIKKAKVNWTNDWLLNIRINNC